MKKDKTLSCLPKCPECGATLFIYDVVKGIYRCYECNEDYTDSSSPEGRLEYLEEVVNTFLEFLEAHFPTANATFWPCIYNGTVETCWWEEGRCGDFYWKKEKISLKDLFKKEE